MMPNGEEWHYLVVKFDKTPAIIYVDLESLIKKVDGLKNNPEK